MKDQMNKNKGFSLIELLIAITLLAIIMIAVIQFMSTSSGALSKTKKNLNLQTEAIEVGEQLSDSFAQATYIRVSTMDGKLYKLDNHLGSNQRKMRAETADGSISGDLVVDNFPNYLVSGTTDRKIILDDTNYTLVNESTAVYCDETGAVVNSFRVLTKNHTAGEPYYVKPQYIYIRYQKKIDGSENEAYVIYYFKDKEIYMTRGDLSELAGAGGTVSADGYRAAVAKVNAKAAKPKGENGLLTDALTDCYFSADTEENTVFLDMLLEDTRYKMYSYNYAETVLLRNSNVLTVAPQKMYKKK